MREKRKKRFIHQMRLIDECVNKAIYTFYI